MSRRHQNKRVLYLIAGLLLASGLFRIVGGATVALAEGSQAEPEPPEEIAQEAPPPDYSGIEAIVAELNAREEALLEREAALDNRMQALRVAEMEISGRLEELRAAEESLEATIALAETAAEDDLTSLTSVYENMKPADAAALFQEMSPEFAAGFLGRMRPDAAAAILAGLEPNHAYSISVLLAGRNVNVPTE